MAEGKINVYNLGEKGINLVKSPVHLDDGELRLAQNATLDPDNLEGGIRKRGGMTAVNVAPLGGAVRGLINVPVEAKQNYDYYFGPSMNGGGAAYLEKSTDGSTWNDNGVNDFGGLLPDDTIAAPAIDDGTYNYAGQDARTMVVLRGKVYYARHNQLTLQAAIRRWDTGGDVEVVKVPLSPQSGASGTYNYIVNLYVADGKIYLSVCDGPGTVTHGRVLVFDPDDESLLQIGGYFHIDATGANAGENPGGVPKHLVKYAGRLWVATFAREAAASAYTCRVYSIRPDIDEEWTEETTFASGLDGWNMAVYRGDLYVGTTSYDNAVAPIVKKRTATGTWSTVRTGTVGFGGFASFFVWSGDLYCYYWSDAGAREANLLKCNSSGVWSSVRDIKVTDSFLGATSGTPVVVDDVAILPFVDVIGSGLMLRNAGGGWTNVRSASGVDFHHGEGQLIAVPRV